MVSLTSSTSRSDGQRGKTDELTRVLGAHLRHHIADLTVESSDKKCITVTGRSKTYHGKQLATHALFTAVPGVEVRNHIVVCRD